MEAQGKFEEGICVVSFDGGGPGTISQLLMIDEFMTRITFELDKDEDELRPADYFDLMGGVGFGGQVPGRLRVTPNEAMSELSTIATATFSKESDESVLPEANMNRLRESIKIMLQRRNYPVDLKLRNDLNQRCKVVVFAATTDTMAHCHPFRTYRSRHRAPDCTFVEAACAIMAIPEFFSPVAIGPPSAEQMFSGIPYGFNNPTREVFKEARLIFGDEKRVSLILSVGSGQQPVLSSSEQHSTLLTRITRDCDTVARELSHQLSSAGAYLRLNVDKGMENIKPSDCVITAHVDEASQWLLKRIGSATLGELIGTGNVTLIKFQSQRLSDQLTMEFKQMCNILQQGMERITLVDAVGNRIPIPMQLCQTYSLLSGIIRSYFEDRQPPGSSLVKHGCYQLLSGTKKEVIEPAGWTNIVLPGLTIEMSMVLHDRDKHSRNCPRCGRVSGAAKNEWATWKVLFSPYRHRANSIYSDSCHLQFQITDKMTRDEVVSPAVYVVFFATRKSVDIIYASRMSEKPGLANASVMERAGEVDDRMKFRLISVINHLNAAYAVARNQSRARHPANMTRPQAGQKRPFNDTEDQVSSQPGPPVKRPVTPPAQISGPIKRGEIRTPEDARKLLTEAFNKAEEQAMISQSQGQGSQDLDVYTWLSQNVRNSADPGPSTLLTDMAALLPMANEPDSQVEGAETNFSDYSDRATLGPESHNDAAAIPPSYMHVLGNAEFFYDDTVEELDEPWAIA